MDNASKGTKVTQSDIAKKLGLSRNTVSKVLNGDLGVSESIRNSVINAAAELGYKWLAPVESIEQNTRKSIALVNSSNAFLDTFWHPFVVGLESVLRAKGFNLVMCMFNEEDEDQLIIPCGINTEHTAGIVLTGLYKREYAKKIIDIGLPVVSVDTFYDIDVNNLISDTIMMENERGVFEATTALINQGHMKIGFSGDIYACRSFYERWLGYKHALEAAGLEVDEGLCLLNRIIDSRYSTREKLDKSLDSMKEIPTAMVCCNDGRAIDLMMLLKKRGIRIPEDIAIVGFDDIKESQIFTPSITSVHCYGEDMGKRTAWELLWRMENTDSPFEQITIPTKVIYRDSTEKTIE